MKYANDIQLTELSQAMRSHAAAYERCLTNGELKTAFLLAMEVERFARKCQDRLNEIQYPPK